MIKRKVAIILFHNNGTILIQDRKEMSKHGEEYGFFGGKMEGDESPEQALKRELKEELNIEVKNPKLFKHYKQLIPEINRDVERWIYLSSIPDLKELNVQEGKLALMKFENSFNLKMIPGDVELLKEIYESLNKK